MEQTEGIEPPITRSGERRIADRRRTPRRGHLTFAEWTEIFNGLLKLMVGGCLLLILVWRSYYPNVSLFPVWLVGLLGGLFFFSWMVDGATDIRRVFRDP